MALRKQTLGLGGRYNVLRFRNWQPVTNYDSFYCFVRRYVTFFIIFNDALLMVVIYLITYLQVFVLILFALVELIKFSNRLISSDSIHPKRYLVNELISPILNPRIFACTYFRDIFAST